jgi:hypothetical protein
MLKRIVSRNEFPQLELGDFGHNKNRQEIIMSVTEYNKIRKARLEDLPHLPAHLVIEWLNTQSDFMGEAVAKAIYTQLNSTRG